MLWIWEPSRAYLAPIHEEPDPAKVRRGGSVLTTILHLMFAL